MAGPGASGPAGRARCPDTIIGLASAGVFCGGAARERGWSRIIDGIRDWGDRTERGVADMENRNLGLGRGRLSVPVVGLATGRRN